MYWSRFRTAALAISCAVVLAGCGASNSGGLTITEPKNGASVQGPKVKVAAKVDSWKLVDAGTPVKEKEGHLHFIIDQPASAIKTGQPIPAGQPAYVHLGKAPYDNRELTLTPGQHTITVVMGDSNHVAQANPAPQSVTVTVK